MKKLLLISSLTLLGATSFSSEFMPANVNVVKCTDGETLATSVSFSTDRAQYEGIIVRAIRVPGTPAQPQSYIRLKTPTLVSRQEMGSDLVWAGQGFKLSIGMESFIPMAADEPHVANLSAQLDNGQVLTRSLKCILSR